MTDYLTVAEVLAMHTDQIERYGGSEGVRDPGLLEAALYRPQTGYYADLIEEAAALWESLAQNHAFIDGNKRTAFAATYTFLAINGARLATFPLKIPKMAQTALACRNGSDYGLSKGERRRWLRKNLLRIGVREGSEGEWYIRLRENSARACLLCQVGTDMDDVVGDHAESDPAPNAVRSFVERSPQPMPAFENTDAAFTAGAPFLKFFEPTLFLTLLAGWTLGVMTRNRYPTNAHLLGLGFIGG
jgi:death-on-curing protein